MKKWNVIFRWPWGGGRGGGPGAGRPPSPGPAPAPPPSPSAPARALASPPLPLPSPSTPLPRRPAPPRAPSPPRPTPPCSAPPPGPPPPPPGPPLRAPPPPPPRPRPSLPRLLPPPHPRLAPPPCRPPPPPGHPARRPPPRDRWPGAEAAPGPRPQVRGGKPSAFRSGCLLCFCCAGRCLGARPPGLGRGSGVSGRPQAAPGVAGRPWAAPRRGCRGMAGAKSGRFAPHEPALPRSRCQPRLRRGRMAWGKVAGALGARWPRRGASVPAPLIAKRGTPPPPGKGGEHLVWSLVTVIDACGVTSEGRIGGALHPGTREAFPTLQACSEAAGVRWRRHMGMRGDALTAQTRCDGRSS